MKKSTVSPKLPPADLPPADAIAVLMADHKRIRKLFAEFAALTDSGSDDEKSAVVAAICRALTLHTLLEEEIFYPAVRRAIENDDLMDEALVEHAGAKDLISQLQAAHPDDDLYDAKVTVLGEQIDHHVLEEEGSMFPRAAHGGIDLAGLGAQMMARASKSEAARPARAARKKTAGNSKKR